MKWGDVNHTHNGKEAVITDPYVDMWRKSTTLVGVVQCENEGDAPVLVGKRDETYALPLWYDVELEID